MGRPAIIEPVPIPLADEELTARLFRAMGDATRLSILELLLESGPRPRKTLWDRSTFPKAECLSTSPVSRGAGLSTPKRGDVRSSTRLLPHVSEPLSISVESFSITPMVTSAPAGSSADPILNAV